jgi:hypothetical protein
VTALPAPPYGEARAEPGRLARLTGPVVVGGLAALGAVALHLRDPHTAGSWGFCPVALLGFSCPACGSLRAVNDLTHRDLAAALSSNLLLVLAVPVGLALWGRRLVALWRGGAATAPLAVPRGVWVALGVVVVVFTVARNLPFGAWLAP